MDDEKLEPMFPPKDPLYPEGVGDPLFHNGIMDPLGSWTGTPANPYEVPTQDADDL